LDKAGRRSDRARTGNAGRIIAMSQLDNERQIRVFISSTFCDMQEDRDFLVKKIFPQLRKLCEEHAVTWTEVDFRWGITNEQAAEGKVLPLCLEEVQRCRPYFIGLLGERYGSMPEPNSISAELLQSHPWLKDQLKCSITELEILHGVFNQERMHGHAYFYFRNPKYVESVSPELRPRFTSENSVAAENLLKLKQKIRSARDEQTCHLRENYTCPEQLGEWILKDFSELIDLLYPKDQAPSPLDQEAARHEAYAQSRRLAFVGRADFLRRLNVHAAAPGKPLVLTGDSGCGKSALLAEWVVRWREDHAEDLIIQHFIGSTTDSADWQGLIRRILGELKRAFGITDDVPIQTEALLDALAEWTVKAAGPRRVVLVLDGINQLSEDNGSRQLGWLPLVFPTNFRVLISSLPGESLDAMRKRRWPELEVPLFSATDIEPAARAYFKIFGKTPPTDLMIKLKDTSMACNALYLRAVLDELRQFGKHEELQIKATEYLSAPSLPELFDRILTRWNADFGNDPQYPDLVRRSLCLIECARFGLLECELLDLLGTKGEPLPRHPWTPFFLAAESWLVLRNGLLGFGHQYLRAAVQKRWLRNEKTARIFHKELAEYFLRIREPTLRKIDELPWQQRRANDLEELTKTLTDPELFECAMAVHREYEWIAYWDALSRMYEPENCYAERITRFLEEKPTLDRLADYSGAAGRLLRLIGRYRAASDFLEQATMLREKANGEQSPMIVADLIESAMLRIDAGDYSNALVLLNRALPIVAPQSPTIINADSPHQGTLLLYAHCAAALGLAYHKRGFQSEEQGLIRTRSVRVSQGMPDYKLAAQCFETAYMIFRKLGSDNQLSCLACLSNLGLALCEMRADEEAEPILRQCIAQHEKARGTNHPDTAKVYNNLALLLSGKGEFEEAHALYERAIIILVDTLGEGHPYTITMLSNHALLFQIESRIGKRGSYSASTALWKEALKLCHTGVGDMHPVTRTVRKHLLNNYRDFVVRIVTAFALVAAAIGLAKWSRWLWFASAPLIFISFGMLLSEWKLWAPTKRKNALN